GKLAMRFAQGEQETLCAVERVRPGNTDDLMLWIQCLRSLRRFRDVLQKLNAENAIALATCEAHIEIFKQPTSPDHPYAWALSWFDTFFPLWSRLCFASRAVVFQNDASVPVDAL